MGELLLPQRSSSRKHLIGNSCMRNLFIFIVSIFSLTHCFSVEINKDSQYFEALIDLDNAYNLAQKIKDEDVKLSLLDHLDACKVCFQNDFKTKDFAHMADRAMCLNENMGEILSDSGQDDVNMKISAHIKNMAEKFQE